MPVIARKATSKPQFTAWSFSRYSDYNDCPRKAYLKHIASRQNPLLKEPGSPAMDRGTAIHGKAEAYVKGEDANGKKVSRIAPELAAVTDTLKMLRDLRKKKPDQVIVEDNWAFRRDWSQTVWNDWNGCAVRIKLDFAYVSDSTTLNIGDWKTGKFNGYKLPAYLEQQELYALAGLLKFPKAELVVPKLYFTDADVVYPRDPAVHPGTQDPEFVFTRKDEPKLIKLWDKRTKKMLADTSFKATPGDACRFCYYRANGPLGDAHCKYKG